MTNRMTIVSACRLLALAKLTPILMALTRPRSIEWRKRREVERKNLLPAEAIHKFYHSSGATAEKLIKRESIEAI